MEYLEIYEKPMNHGDETEYTNSDRRTHHVRNL